MISAVLPPERRTTEVAALPDRLPQVRLFFRLLAVGLGALHAWVASVQQSMNADGISYLDMGEAYFRGDWATAVNTVWSPLYAWILGAAMTALQPAPAWEPTLVHLLNFGCFLFALVCFEYFWSRLGERRRHALAAGSGPSLVGWPEWAWTAIGYMLFLWAGLALVAIWTVTPDMLTAGFVLLAAGLLVRIGSGERASRVFLAFGVILGLGYLAKSVMFPLAFVFLAASWLVSGRNLQAARRVSLALLAFLLVAGPYVALLSASKGRPTFGDGGRLTYLRYANGVVYPHWREGTGAATGRPHDPPRQISDDPVAFEFAAPVGGSYPLSYDPSYWYEGLSPRLEPRMQLARLVESLRFYLDMFVGVQGGVAAIVLLLLLFGAQTMGRPIQLPVEWVLVGTALTALALYALVYVEGRYVAPFLLLLWGGLLAGIRVPAADWARRLLATSAVSILLLLTLTLGTFHLDGFVKVAGLAPPSDVLSRSEAPSYRPVQMAAELTRMGIGPGDDIVYIGDSFHAYFVRLARLRIIAEIPDIEQAKFWQLEPTRRADLMVSLRATGARAIVAERVPHGALLHGWKRIGGSRHYLYPLY